MWKRGVVSCRRFRPLIDDPAIDRYSSGSSRAWITGRYYTPFHRSSWNRTRDYSKRRAGKKPPYSCLTAAAAAAARRATPRRTVLYTYVMNHPVHRPRRMRLKIHFALVHVHRSAHNARRAVPRRATPMTNVTELVAHHFILFLGFHPSPPGGRRIHRLILICLARDSLERSNSSGLQSPQDPATKYLSRCISRIRV